MAAVACDTRGIYGCLAIAAKDQQATRRNAPGAGRSSGAFAKVDEISDARIRHAGCGYLLDASRSVLWRQAIGGGYKYRKSLALVGPGHKRRTEFNSRIPVRCDLPEPT